MAATRSRKIKLAALAEVLGRAGAGEVGPAAAFLAGQLRQGRVGVGWASISAVAVEPALSPTLTVTDLDHTVTQLAGLAGAGSGAARTAALAGCSGGPPRRKPTSCAGCSWATSARAPWRRW